MKIKKKCLFLVILIVGLNTTVFAKDFVVKDSELIYDESVARNINNTSNINKNPSISPLYIPCTGSHRHLSRRIYTGFIKTSYPPLYQVICYWCGGYEWIYEGPK